MRRLNHRPLAASISRSIGVGSRNTCFASADSMLSDASDLRSSRGRPMSVAMTLNSMRVAGVKKRILNSASRKMVATSVLKSTFCRSSEVVRWRSRVSCS